jgi:hypothetical protein
VAEASRAPTVTVRRAKAAMKATLVRKQQGSRESEESEERKKPV